VNGARQLLARLLERAAATAVLCAPICAQTQWIADGPHRGLPSPEAAWRPYDQDLAHPANRIFASTFLVELVPAEVGAALPAEAENATAHGADARHFGKRPGEERDRRLFGGDALQLPRESFSEAESKALLAALEELRGEPLAALRTSTFACVWLQNDILRLARRLLDTDANPELLAPLLDAARRLAFPRAQLLDSGLATFSTKDLAAIEPGIDPEKIVEVERRSTRLFDAERSLLWSRVFFHWPGNDGRDFAAELAAIAKGEAPKVPTDARAILVQGIVALDDRGAPCATPLAIDVRLQQFVGAADPAAAKATTTHDGVDFRMFWLSRETLRTKGGAVTLRDFREVGDEDQVLFRDYGTLKHTTVGAQCTLCHRVSGTPEPELAGFPLLRKTAQPRVASSPTARLELAEREFVKFLAALASAAKRSSVTTR
jgi:hypothetical protein